MAFALCLNNPAAIAQDDEVEPEITLENAANNSIGIIVINQDTGQNNNQGNVLSISIAAGGAAVALATADGQVPAAQVFDYGVMPSLSVSNVSYQASGILGINQSAGTGSQQFNTIAVAYSPDGLAVSDVSVGLSRPSLANSSAGQDNLMTGLLDSSGRTSISGLGNEATGIFAVNQDAGNFNSQVNALSLAGTNTGVALASATLDDASGSGQQPAAQEETTSLDGVVPALPHLITDSFNNAAGLVQINQASGVHNQQTNLLAIAFGMDDSAVAVADAALGAVQPALSVDGAPAQNELENPGTSIRNSFDGFTGIAQTHQTHGVGNQVSNSLGISLTTVVGG